MNIQLLALLLLAGRLISDFFIVLVLRRQWVISKTKTHPRLMAYRRVLSTLAILIFIFNIYPLALDTYTLFHPSIRTSPTVNFVGVIYTLGNSIGFMIASILVYALYKLGDTVIEVAELIGVDARKTDRLKK